MRLIRTMMVLGIFILLVGVVSAQFSSSSFIRGERPINPQSLYGSEYDVYWPQLVDPESCFSREDIILQMSPAGCQPAVVRSDLLAEQNVPVFCQIDGLKINPLIDIKQIRNIRFTGEYPEEVIGAGFHPARAALRSQDRLLGDPLINNIGYVVTVLKRNPVEADLPDKIEFVLNAQIEYDAGNAFGVGDVEFLLEEYETEEEWLRNRNKNSFWKGRYFVRAEEIKADYVVISIYHGDRKVSTTKVNIGDNLLHDIFLPGLYCQANLNAEYKGFVDASTTALIRVDEDLIEVSEGSMFLNNKCRVQSISSSFRSKEGRVNIICGSERIDLGLKAKIVRQGDQVALRGEEGSIVWIIDKIISEIRYLISNGGETREVGVDEVNFVGADKLIEAKYDEDTEKYFADAIASYEQVVDDYPAEKVDAIREETYAEQAMLAAIELSDSFGKQLTEARLINEFIILYPDSPVVEGLVLDLNELYVTDKSDATHTVLLDNRVASIRLVSFQAKGSSSADFTWGSEIFRVGLRESEIRIQRGELTLAKIGSADTVDVSVLCSNEADAKSESIVLRIGEQKAVCNQLLILKDVNQQRLAKVRLLPKVGRVETETNFTVSIGIEKRAIKLNPKKAKDKIDNLEETIEKWTDISDSLNDINTGLKSACFATAGVLTVKNFLAGLGGEGFSRQKVMRGYWIDECARLVDSGEYVSLDQCYLGEAGSINSDVSSVNNILNGVSDRVKSVQDQFSRPVKGVGGLFGETVINTEDSANSFVDNFLLGDEKYSTYQIDLGEGEVTTIGELLGDADYGAGDYSYDQVREIMFNIDVSSSGVVSDGLRESANEELGNIGKLIGENKILSVRLNEARVDFSKGLPALGSLLGGTDGRVNKISQVSTSESVGAELGINFNVESTHVSQFPAPAAAGFASGVYVLGLSRPSGSSNVFLVNQVFRRDDSGQYVALPQEKVNEFQVVYGIDGVEATESLSLSNKYVNPEVRFFETEPFRGMPAVVPFDLANGWYAATEQTLPVFGSIASFDSSGAPRSFWVCNVGRDGREQFFENRARDICQLINLNTGQPLNQFPGLDESTAQAVIGKAIQALQDASRQYEEGRRGVINVLGNSVPVGLPAANVPGTQCQEFMSPGDCNLLFNVCDPVICPSSRCDFGGEYPVADVIQTGIVGSLLLCAPNIREGIFLPICLTGVQAGVDGYLSILQSHQQCLQEQIETGQTVGICDELTSIYTCEFFWRQAAPLADIVVPKVFEVVTGQTRARGGAEYLNVQNAWQTVQGSVEFFTQSYAVNSIEAFKLRSTEEAGSQFCKAFISAKGPGSLKALVEPDSPSQFHAWFSSTRFTDATLPATSQYKVFYHIFAGKDTGAPYSVYLRDPPRSSFFNIPPSVQVANGFVPRGGFVTDTVDFTAPEGYKELCVRINDKEECGFKQVSTSFAVNYLRDEFISDELTRTDIISQNDCVSGSGLSAVSLLNPNPQAAFEEAINPEIYSRGVIRICSSQNPGSATEPDRFVNVGYCEDPSVRCWLDKVSIDASLSRNLDLDEGVKDRTLSQLQSVELQNLKNAGEVLEINSISAIIIDVESQIKFGLNMNRAHELLAVVDGTLQKTILNYQKAKLVLLKGRIYSVVAERIKRKATFIEDPGQLTEEEIEELVDSLSEEEILELLNFVAPALMELIPEPGETKNLNYGEKIFDCPNGWSVSCEDDLDAALTQIAICHIRLPRDSANAVEKHYGFDICGSENLDASDLREIIQEIENTPSLSLQEDFSGDQRRYLDFMIGVNVVCHEFEHTKHITNTKICEKEILAYEESVRCMEIIKSKLDCFPGSTSAVCQNTDAAICGSSANLAFQKCLCSYGDPPIIGLGDNRCDTCEERLRQDLLSLDCVYSGVDSFSIEYEELIDQSAEYTNELYCKRGANCALAVITSEEIEWYCGDVQGQINSVPEQDCSVTKVESTREEVGVGESFSVRVDYSGGCEDWGVMEAVLDKAGDGEIGLPDYVLTAEDKLRGYYIFSYSIDEEGIYIFVIKSKYVSEDGSFVSGVDYDVNNPEVNSQISVG